MRNVLKGKKISADWDDPVWRNTESLLISCSMEEPPSYRPVTEVKLKYDEERIRHFRVQDRYVRTTRKEYSE